LKNVIEINGRKYDAQSGKLLDDSKAKAPVSNPIPTSSNSQVIDGVQRSNTQSTTREIAKPVSHKPEIKPKSTTPNTSRRVVDGFRKKTQKSTTLSRKVVKNPHKNAPNIHAKSLPNAPVSSVPVTPEKSSIFKKVPDARLARAMSQKTSSVISKFSKDISAVKPVINHNLKVKQPENHQKLATSNKSIVEQSNLQKQVFQHSISNQTTHRNDAVNIEKKVTTPVHKKVAHTVARKRYMTGLVAACFAFLLLGGFIAYQRIPQLAVKVAARQAGFNAKVPSAIPSGFSFKSPVKAEKDSLTIAYNSNTDSRNFVVTQKPTTWTSESLLSSFLVNSKRQYQTYYDKGLTVFVYDTSNATWVDKGIWYTIETDGSLSSEQILSIASSI
jgi:hypothetical protein